MSSVSAFIDSSAAWNEIRSYYDVKRASVIESFSEVGIVFDEELVCVDNEWLPHSRKGVSRIAFGVNVVRAGITVATVDELMFYAFAFKLYPFKITVL